MSPPGPGDGPGSLFEELRRGLETRVDRLRERLDERLWGPLTELAVRLEERAAKSRTSADPLRDAGRVLRLACDEVETIAAASVLESEIRHHLEDILPLAHSLPRSMALGEAGGGSRRVPARSVAAAVLQGDYPAALLERLRPEALVTSAPASLPPSPADLLGNDDWRARLAGAVEGAREHLSRVLDEAAASAVEEIRERLGAGGPFSHLRARMRSRAAERKREETLAAIRRALADADEEGRGELRHRRLAADLARRERALREAASRAGALARGAAAESARIRRIAEGLDALAGGDEADAPGEDRPPGRHESVPATDPALGRLVERIRAALEERREALGSASAPGEELDAALARLARRASALAGVAEEFLAREEGAAAPAPPSGELDGAMAEVVGSAAMELGDELRERLEEAREGLREAGEIVRHGAEAARAGEHEGGGPAQTVAGACRRAAHRLRETAHRLDRGMEASASAIEELPDRLLATIRDRVAPGRRGAAEREAAAEILPGGAAAPGRRSWPGRVAARIAALWRAAVGRVRRVVAAVVGRVKSWLPTAGAGPAGEPVEAPGAGEGGVVAAWVAELEEGSGLSGLPSNYRWLFRDEAVDDPRLVVAREEAFSRLRDLRSRWEEGRPAAMAVVGEPGSGKTTLLNCATADFGDGAEVRRGRVDRRLGTPREALAWLWSFLGPVDAGAAPERAEVHPAPEDLDALIRVLGERREIVLLENGERLFRRDVGGYGAAATVGQLLEATAGRIAWVVTFERAAWGFLETVSPLASCFDGVIDLRPPGRAELEEAIMVRHRLTGYDLDFEMSGDGLSTARRTRLHASSATDRVALQRAWCLDELYGDGDRPIGEALFLWRRCLRPAPGEVATVRARWRPVPDPSPLQELNRTVLFAIASVVLHGDLEEEALGGNVGGAGGAGVARILETSGLVEPVPGLPPPAPIRLRPFLYRMVMKRLRDANVLPLAGEAL